MHKIPPKTLLLLLYFFVGAAVQIAYLPGDLLNTRYDLSLDQKKQDIFGYPYQFAKKCTALVSTPHAAKLITDRETNESEFMIIQRILSYFLYPKIDLRVSPAYKPIEAYVIYEKKDPLTHVPPDYEIVYFDKKYQNILAIKKDALHAPGSN